MKALIQNLEYEFIRNSNPVIAKGQKAYMKNNFEFYGIQSGLRRQIQAPFFVKKYMPAKSKAFSIAKALWQKPQREFQYFAMELVEKYKNEYEKNDIDLISYLIQNKTWWDTVDFIAQKIAGSYFVKYPTERQTITDKWIASENIWLQRSSIIFQLKYKEKTDVNLLKETIIRLKDTDEFFLNKAIGWALREYGKTNPDWVLDFVAKTRLHPLSKREALRIILKK